MRRARRLFSFATVAVTALLVLGGCDARQSAMIDIALDRNEESTAGVTTAGGRAVIDVTDRRGINGLTASLEDGQWPEEIVVRLNLKGLEHLEIRYGNFAIATGMSSNDSPDAPLILSVTDDQGQVHTASPSADIYYPDISRTADGFEIALPPHFFLKEYPSFTMRWIDYYR